MKRILALLMALALAQGAWAGEKGVAEKAGDTVKKGAEATERGLKKGSEATVSGLKKAGEWFGKQVRKGSKKVEKASK